MAFLKCKMCGGDLNFEEGVTVVECEYCGTKQTVPNIDDEKKITLFGRANRLRYACEFDKASGIYESIIADFPEEAEAYWGLVLCKYGIEYVDDPATGKKVPTCHRSSFESVMEDDNFEQVLENADPIARSVYREEAKQIEELRRGIIEVSGREEPYDIFICYKETAENGERTIDSVIAQDVYQELTAKGYRVFFSRITLEDKLGQEYEPYIFAALNSAKIMLAFGTDYEYYNAVWVKNEWSRFLQLIAKGEKKTLIPCYKNIDAYDMPKEFAKLQAQDMGKVGAVQDLLRGIEKLLPKNETAPVKETVVVQQTAGSATTDSLLKRAFMYLEDGDWKNANEYCEKILDIIPECGDAYLGKLMAELRCKKREMLADGTVVYDNSNNYLKAVRFGSEELKKELMEYDVTVKYRKASEKLKNALKKEDFLEAEKMFRLILGYRDADEKAKEASEGWSVRVREAHECFNIWKESKIWTEDILQSLKNEKVKLESEKSMLGKRMRDYPSIKEKADKLANEKVEAEGEIRELEEKISELEREKNALGLFAGKQKRELQDRINTLNSELREKVRDHDIRLNPLYNTAEREYEEYENAMNPERCQARIAEIDAQMAEITEKIATDEKRKAEIRMTPAKAERAIMSERYSGILTGDISVLREIVNNCKLFEVLVKNDIYKTSMVKAESLLSDLTIQQRAALELTIYLGRYSNKPIEWKILAIKTDRALLITKDKICCRRYAPEAKSFTYNDRYDFVEMKTWDKSSLRDWLNDEFYNNTFSTSEKVKILSSTIGNSQNPKYEDVSAGNVTNDNVFLLSIREVEQYFSSDRDRAIDISWWLRSPGSNCCYRAASVNNDGSIDYYGNSVNSVDVGVRPALWINL